MSDGENKPPDFWVVWNYGSEGARVLAIYFNEIDALRYAVGSDYFAAKVIGVREGDLLDVLV